MSEFKYIIIEVILDKILDSKVFIPIIFPKVIAHIHMAESTIRLLAFEHEWTDTKVISAGSISLFDLKCYGRSSSLDIDSRGHEDTMLIKAYSMLAHS